MSSISEAIPVATEVISDTKSNKSTDDSSTNGVVWCIQTAPSTWTPLWKCDNEKVEAAFLRDEVNEPIVIHNTHRTVHFDSRTVTEAYIIDAPARPLRRTLWFYVLHGKRIPFEEQVSVAIEHWQLESDFKRTEGMKNEASLKLVVGDVFGSSHGEYSVVATRNEKTRKGTGNDNSPVVYDVEVTFALMKSNEYLAPFSLSYPVQRGMPLNELEEEKRSKLGLPKSLAFVVHGIGESMCNTEGALMPSIKEAVGKLNALCTEYSMSGTIKGAQNGNGRSVGPSSSSINEAGAAPAAPKDGSDAASKGETQTVLDKGKLVDLVPIEWHGVVHGEEFDVTRQMKTITCSTVPIIRQFGNSAVTDLLIYQTPEFQKRITSEAVNKMNQVYTTYCERNPELFDGKATIVAHSLGSVIIFDILSLQERVPECVPNCDREQLAALEKAPFPTNSCVDPANYLLKQQGYLPQTAPSEEEIHRERALALSKVQLIFRPQAFIALGSPVGMFYTLRSKGTLLSPKYTFPTCSRAYNVFHPLDPVAYRWEPLFHPKLQDVDPAVVDHHGGMRTKYVIKRFTSDINRKMEQLNNMPRQFSSDIQKRVEAVGNVLGFTKGWLGTNGKPEQMHLAASTMTASSSTAVVASSQAPSKPEKPRKADSQSNYGTIVSISPAPSAPLAPESEKDSDADVSDAASVTASAICATSTTNTAGPAHPKAANIDFDKLLETMKTEQPLQLVDLNGGNRMDYTLQETFLESSNEYLGALTSHSSYFENKDVAMFIVDKINGW